MEEYFFELTATLFAQLSREEILLCSFDGEDSDFVRLNHNAIRQAGRVTQRYLHLDLIRGARHATASATLTGQRDLDLPPLHALLQTLRDQLPLLPEDPYLMYATQIHNTTRRDAAPVIDSAAAIDTMTQHAQGLDLVGLWASGTLYDGFANSLGQRNWHQSNTFNFDWSCYFEKDKAVKCNYAGFDWDPRELQRKLDDARVQLETIARPSRTLSPGNYRAYFAPAALEEILGVVSWGGFGLKAQRTGHSSLLKLLDRERSLHRAITLRNDATRPLSPNFTASGFVFENPVTMIADGAWNESLASPRSAKEFNVPFNSGSESPHALDMDSGTLARADILRQLDTGLYINNLWYCNYSDRDDCRITGMTRFACFWVEHGVIQAPIHVMRFDDSVYRLLGSQLVDLTREREFLFDTSTYGSRSTRSAQLPGALVDDFALTL